MHNAYITTNKIKMSKSEGNFFTVRDIRQKYDGEEIRFFLLSGQYRNPIDFSEELMQQSRSSLDRMRNCKADLEHMKANGADGEMTDEEKAAAEGFDEYRQKFITAMDDDLNTADGISAVFELISSINGQLKGGATKAFAGAALDVLMELCDVLGLLQQSKDDGIDPEIQKLIDERQEARKAKNFARADEIRDMLKAQGITLKDTPQGVQVIKE